MAGVVTLFKGAQEAPADNAFLAFVSDDASWQVARAVAGEMGWPGAVVHRGGAGDVLELFAGRMTPPRILLVDLDGAANPFVTVARLASLAGEGTRLIGLGTANDVDLYRDLLSAGAADYLVKPLAADALHQIIRQASQTPARTAKVESEPGRLVVVVGVRGGVGASTVAVNAAWLLAHDQKRKTALLDLDLQFGTDTLALDLEPGRGLREALETPNRLDSLLIASSMVMAGERLSVLGAEEPVEDVVSFGPTALSALLEELRGNHEMVVIDMPRHLVPAHRPVIGSAHQVILVSDLSLAGIRDTVRLSAAIRVLGGPACLVVASRAGGTRKPQVDRATFERGIQGSIAHLVPEDEKTMTVSANQGKAAAAVAPSSAMVKSIRALAQGMTDATAAPVKRGLLGWFRRDGA